MILEHNCFPESWIGKEPVKVGDGSTYFIGNDSNRPIILPSNHKGLRAVWLNNGVLRIDTNINNTKLFYVGCQRYFEAYQNETEPHDQYSYQEAVKECQRLRAEEARRNNPKQDSSDNYRELESENSSKSKGAGFGLGAMIGSAVSAVKDFRSIDDSSSLEERGNLIMQNMVNRMEDIYRRNEEEGKERTRLLELRNKELDELRVIEKKIKAKENKKKIFSNLNEIFKEATFIPDKFLCSYLEVHNPQQKVAISNVLRGYNNSIVQLVAQLGDVQFDSSRKFFLCWSEIIYLVGEGFLFEDKHIKEITQLINIACGIEEKKESGNYNSFDDYLKALYSKSKYAYWGCDFETNPKDNIIKDRIKYLERHSLFLDKDEYYQGYDVVREIINDFEKRYGTVVDNTTVSNKQNENEKSIATASKDIPQNTAPSKDIPHKDSVNAEKYNDLNSVGFKKESCEGDLLKPKNAFDLITKGKNKKISNIKGKWNDAMWNLDHKLKKNVERDILKIEKEVSNLLKLEEELQNLIASGKSDGFFGFGGDKNVKKKKSDIKDVKERIIELKEKLEDSVEDLQDCEEDIKDYQEDLYELTGLEKYKSYKPVEGKGIDLAHQLIKSIKNSDSQMLRNLFEL